MSGLDCAPARRDTRMELSLTLKRRGWGWAAAAVLRCGSLDEILLVLSVGGLEDSDAYALIGEARAAEMFAAACRREQDAQRALTAAGDEVRLTRARLTRVRRVAAERLT